MVPETSLINYEEAGVKIIITCRLTKCTSYSFNITLPLINRSLNSVDEQDLALRTLRPKSKTIQSKTDLGLRLAIFASASGHTEDCVPTEQYFQLNSLLPCTIMVSWTVLLYSVATLPSPVRPYKGEGTRTWVRPASPCEPQAR